MTFLGIEETGALALTPQGPAIKGGTRPTVCAEGGPPRAPAKAETSPSGPTYPFFYALKGIVKVNGLYMNPLRTVQTSELRSQPP